MLWVLYSVLSGFFIATSDAFTKKARVDDDYVVAWSRFFFAIPILLILLLFTSIPQIDTVFWITILFLAPLDVTLLLLYIRAIRISPLSLTLPLFSFTPVFLILTSFIFLGEFPGMLGIFGIALVVIGAYILNLSKRTKGLLAPFKALTHEKGAVLILIAAFIASITSNLVKIAVLHSSAIFFVVFHSIVILIILSVLFFKKIKNSFNEIKSDLTTLSLVGLSNGLMFLFHALAVTLVIVPFMISLKRTSSLFGVLYGHFLFKEKNIKERLMGAAVMLIGAALIILL